MCGTPNLSDPDHESEHFPPDSMALALLDTGVIPGWSSSGPNLKSVNTKATFHLHGVLLK